MVSGRPERATTGGIAKGGGPRRPIRVLWGGALFRPGFLEHALSDENRKDERLSAEIKVDYRAGGSFVTDYSANVSRTGVFIRTSHPLPVGEKVRLRMQLKAGDAPFALDGVVKWVSTMRNKQHAAGMGVEFVDLPDEVRTQIERLVREVGREGAHTFGSPPI